MSKLHRLLAQRQGPAAPAEADLPPLPPAAHTVFEQLLAHRSVRGYTTQPLSAGTLDLLVAAAQSAPTSSNLQAWSLLVVDDAQRRARLAEWSGNQAHIRQVPLFLVWLADLSRLDRVAARRQEPSQANDYLEQLLVATIDAALAAQNLVVAAESLGLGTVYIGALRNRANQVARELGLPAHVFPLFGLCVGHPDPAVSTGIKPRLSPATVLHRETYRAGADAEAAAVAEYDTLIQQFQRDQGITPVPWSQQASARVRHADSLNGRHQLVAHLHEQGFPLS